MLENLLWQAPVPVVNFKEVTQAEGRATRACMKNPEENFMLVVPKNNLDFTYGSLGRTAVVEKTYQENLENGHETGVTGYAGNKA